MEPRGIWPDMQNIWSAYAGPGVRAGGIDNTTWADQTDVRPTVLALTGLHDDYSVDGRVLVEDLEPNALPHSLRQYSGDVTALGRVYKQILAADGQFAIDTLTASTHALTSGDAGNDTKYRNIEAALTALGGLRDRIADGISSALLGAAFGNHPVDPRRSRALVAEANALLAAAHLLATHT
jgi:hypothetical protein